MVQPVSCLKKHPFWPKQRHRNSGASPWHLCPRLPSCALLLLSGVLGSFPPSRRATAREGCRAYNPWRPPSPPAGLGRYWQRPLTARLGLHRPAPMASAAVMASAVQVAVLQMGAAVRALGPSSSKKSSRQSCWARAHPHLICWSSPPNWFWSSLMGALVAFLARARKVKIARRAAAALTATAAPVQDDVPLVASAGPPCCCRRARRPCWWPQPPRQPQLIFHLCQLFQECCRPPRSP